MSHDQLKHTTSLKACLSLAGALLLSPLQSSWAEARVSDPVEVISHVKDSRLKGAHCLAPQWSPDGQQLAIEVYRPRKDARETWIYKLSSSLGIKSSEQVLPLGVSASRLGGAKLPPVIEFAWTPDMEMLTPPYVFSSQGLQRKNFDIYADGGWLTEANKGNDGHPVFSPDSNYLAYTSQQRDSGDIMLIDFTSSSFKPRRLTNTPTTTEYLPQWHPTQPKLLYIRSQKTRGQDIVLISDVKNPKPKDITNWKGDEIKPHWSPDGKQIAFYSNEKSNKDQIFDLWVINADGTQPRRLAKNVVVDKHKGPAWSADSSKIIYVKQNFKRSNPIFWVDVKSAKSGLLTDKTQLNSNLYAYHSADGETRLAYTAHGKVNSSDKSWKRIYVLTFRSSDLK